ncbi:hypothetical protein Acsp06_62610 [Actinomycetospora sp. NBRC 106375]|uniref:nucleotidyltransferase domain-containing protein n=1 Tax=Actinomycetospora sp. NBRC 106375 TaxID=3032207 RepID=UPI0024A16F86|nr:nucleotidyltransferase domain-containing protein [Actinomycetospora sp. NBRC 106375]GLZ50076.1 hypothetical protein Acsp06_62610 [Actinomycetospora sp. NBRC 106375]
MKRKHSLHASRNAADFSARLVAETGATPSHLVRRFVGLEHPKEIVLAGSIPQGVGTEVSDVDLLVITDASQYGDRSPETQADVVYSGLVLGEESPVVLSTVALAAGVEIDFAVVDADRLAALIRRLSSESLLLTAPQIQLLSGVKSGWPLIEPDRTTPHAEGLTNDSLEIRCTVRYYVAALKALEDALAATQDDERLVWHLSRLCIERGFRAYFASVHHPHLGDKWLRFMSHHLRSPDDRKAARFRDVAQRGSELLMRGGGDPDRCDEHLRDVREWLDSLRGLLAEDLRYGVALRLSPQLDVTITS